MVVVRGVRQGRDSRQGQGSMQVTLAAAVALSAAGPWAMPWGTPQGRPPPTGEGACRQVLVTLCVLDRLLPTLWRLVVLTSRMEKGAQRVPAGSEPRGCSRRPSFLLPG